MVQLSAGVGRWELSVRWNHCGAVRELDLMCSE
jgi:hypothetical protein